MGDCNERAHYSLRCGDFIESFELDLRLNDRFNSQGFSREIESRNLRHKKQNLSTAVVEFPVSIKISTVSREASPFYDKPSDPLFGRDDA